MDAGRYRGDQWLPQGSVRPLRCINETSSLFTFCNMTENRKLRMYIATLVKFLRWLGVHFLAESADVRLIHGNNISHGIVEVWQDNQWQTLCAWPQFLPQDALVVCKQLGFSKGTVLPMAAYGRHTGNHTHPFKGCSGGEIKIQDCKFDENYTPNVCATQDVHYASVSCFDKQEGKILFQNILCVKQHPNTSTFKVLLNLIAKVLYCYRWRSTPVPRTIRYKRFVTQQRKGWTLSTASVWPNMFHLLYWERG